MKKIQILIGVISGRKLKKKTNKIRHDSYVIHCLLDASTQQVRHLGLVKGVQVGEKKLCTE